MPMNHSVKTDEWIEKMYRDNPAQVTENGNILTGLVRLHFANIMEKARPDPKDPDKETKFGTAMLWPAIATQDVSDIIQPLLFARAKSAFPTKFDKESGEFIGLSFPIHPQLDKVADNQGFTRGGVYANASTQYKPRVYDSGFNEITDPKRVYNGVWAVCELNIYDYNDPRRKGVSLGLQSLVIVSDDTRLLSNKVDPKKIFGGLKLDASFKASDAFKGGTKTSTKSNPSDIMPDATEVDTAEHKFF